jgi:hypothetical protein
LIRIVKTLGQDLIDNPVFTYTAGQSRNSHGAAGKPTPVCDDRFGLLELGGAVRKAGDVRCFERSRHLRSHNVVSRKEIDYRAQQFFPAID